jgi:hypothetical protein
VKGMHHYSLPGSLVCAGCINISVLLTSFIITKLKNQVLSSICITKQIL